MEFLHVAVPTLHLLKFFNFEGGINDYKNKTPPLSLRSRRFVHKTCFERNRLVLEAVVAVLKAESYALIT